MVHGVHVALFGEHCLAIRRHQNGAKRVATQAIVWRATSLARAQVAATDPGSFLGDQWFWEPRMGPRRCVLLNGS